MAASSSSPPLITEDDTIGYNDAELKVIVAKPPTNVKEFPLDFDKVWPELGYSTKNNGVRALVKFVKNKNPTSHSQG